MDYFINKNDVLREDMNIVIDAMFDAREYGSIIRCENVRFDLIFDRFEEIKEEISLYKNSVLTGLYPFVYMAYMLNKKYHAVVTNPPYMGASGMGTKLSKYVKDNYPDSKSDLFAVFIEKCGEMTKKNAYQAMITQHAWMFLSSFEKLREKLLQKDIVNMAHLGARAFDEIGGEVVQTTSFVLQNSPIENYKGVYCRLIEPTTQQGKEEMFLMCDNSYKCTQDYFSKIPGMPIAYWISVNFMSVFSHKKLGDVASAQEGLKTADNDRFIRYWYEIDLTKSNIHSSNNHNKWIKHTKGGQYKRWYGNNDSVLNYENDGFELRHSKKASLTGTDNYFKPNITWTRICTNDASFRYTPEGSIPNMAGLCLYCNDIYYYLGLLNSRVTGNCLLIMNPTINYPPGTICKIPIIYEENHSDVVNKIVSRCVENSKADWDAFEISWDFIYHPLIDCYSISEAYATWKTQCDERFNQQKTNEEELNRIFIDIYGLKDELTPEVEDKEITVRKADLQRDIRSFISYAVGCMLGRYSLDKEGLVFAGGDIRDTYSYYGGAFEDAQNAGVRADGKYTFEEIGTPFYYLPVEGKSPLDSWKVDADNCIPITDEEYFTDDIVGRFVEFVKTVYGEDTLEENLDFIAKALGNKGNTSREVIRNYFLKDFYTDHLKVYQKRPIYWLFDSGKENGFKALIYMHRYNADTVGRVRTDYLHRAQKYVETAMQSAQYTIDNATSASEKSKATKAVTKYTKQLAEMKIYDEAIAHIANKRIEIDLDDGVKVNYAKFQDVEVAQEGKKALKVDLLAKLK